MIRHLSTWATVSDRAGRTASARCASTVLLFLVACVPARAAAAVPLPSLLDRVAKQVEKFWSYFPAVTCIEQVSQSKLGDKGKVLLEQRAAFDYLILLQSAGNRISVEESRVEKRHKDPKGKAALLLTNGFSLLTLIFHPIYQSSFEFTSLPKETRDGRRLLRVAFRQIAQNRSPSVLLVRQREYPLAWKGVAWIDPESYSVARIEVGLNSSMEDIGLVRLEAQVDYAPMRFTGADSDYWLPSRAVIEALTKRQHWRNIHLFTDYRRFSVDTEVRTATPQ